VFFYPFEYMSIFKWAFQGSAINEFTDLNLDCTPTPTTPCDALAMHDFDESLEWCFGALAISGVVLRVLAYLGLSKISTPKKAKLIPVDAEKKAA